ncbi:metalloprotease secretion chaperone CpaB [Acinetobacter sp. WZC-1]|uniref:metalloprotease secretion chaperone CpaB n=1 Tax=Acinetobacter sp. WZC-1 TaxID=3459034 RepID=UPI00403E1878
MKKQTYIVIFVVSLIALLVWLMPNQKKVQDKAEANTVRKEIELKYLSQQVSTLHFTEAEVQARVQKSTARRKLVNLDENKLRQGISEKEMFYTSDVNRVTKHNPIELSEAQKNDGRIFLGNNIYTLEGKTIGDRVGFTVPAYGLKREAIIEKIDVDLDDDIVSWSGHLEGGDKNNETFHITQTVKDNFTIGTINSEGRTYAMLMKNGYGWINNVENESAAILAGEGHHDH